MKHSSTESCIKALRVLSQDIQSEDGVANAALAECANRMEKLAELVVKQEERIKRLEEAGDKLYSAIYCGCGMSGPCRKCESAVENWDQANKSKP